ncbi:MAG: chromate efflux transporter [Proteobacteria bacterium]|nr:chromate efflux transporter [Pseudomonadota bacterium]MBI3498610.1 chromate efflux transporter [Pseudomonadota bacterium]
MSERRAGLAEIARVFLKIGAMSYGGPAIMGIMQTEIQEKRQWLSKLQFVEGLALVNMLPGPGATQLGILIGHAKAGLPGGILAGVCFILPAFLIMLLLTAAYVAFGALPASQSAFYGIGPVVVGIFAASIYRLGRATIKERSQIAILIAAASVLQFTSVGLVTALFAAGCIGMALFHARRRGAMSLLLLIAAAAAYVAVDLLVVPSTMPIAGLARQSNPDLPRLWELGTFFLKVGAFSFGGGLSMLAFIQDQVVNQSGWLTQQEFIDGLALGQLTPGPILMLAAFVGFKLAGAQGAAVAAAAIFLPSFLMMLSILPLLRKMKDLQWLKAFMRGVGPAVIGALAVSIVQMAPHAAPDPFAWCLLALTVGFMLLRNVGPLPLMLGGAVIGFMKSSTWDRIERLAR